MTTSIVPGIAPRADVITVTPALAKEWLTRNTRNRPIRKTTVANYARDMQNGKWAMNGEAIKFSADGTLLDGQHRLNAVITAGVPVQMLVITGLANETQTTMDAGVKRTTGDAFGLADEKNAQMLAAVLKKIWMWDKGDHRFSANINPTTAECAALLAKRPEIRRSVEVAVRTRQTFRQLPPSITGTAHHIFSRIAADEAVWFFARVGDGAALDLGHPILALRNRILAEAGDKGTRVHDHQRMAYLVRAWNATREGRSLVRILQPADAPMPQPK